MSFLRSRLLRLIISSYENLSEGISRGMQRGISIGFPRREEIPEHLLDEFDFYISKLESTDISYKELRLGLLAVIEIRFNRYRH